MARELVVGTRRQNEWGWWLILDFFFAGMGSGLFLIALILGVAGAMVAGGILVLVGSLMLGVDLTRRQAAWRLPCGLKRSWVSWGTIGILGFFLLALLHIILTISQFGWTSLGEPWLTGGMWTKVLAGVAGIAALFVATYPGFLLSGMRSIPLWSGTFVPILFPVCALLSGMGAIYLVPEVWIGQAGAFKLLQSLGIGLIVLNLIQLSAVLLLDSSEAMKESVRLLTHGSLGMELYIGIFGLGLIVPLALLIFLFATTSPELGLRISGVFLLLGTFLLRHVIVKAGVYVSAV